MYLTNVRDTHALGWGSPGLAASALDPGDTVLVRAFQEASTSGHFDDIKGLRRMVAWYMMAEASSANYYNREREIFANFGTAYSLVPVVTLVRRLDTNEFGLMFDLLPIAVDGIISKHGTKKSSLHPELRYSHSAATTLASRAGDRAARAIPDAAIVPVGSVVLGETISVRIHRNNTRGESVERYIAPVISRPVRDLSAFAAQSVNEVRDVWYAQRLVWNMQAGSLGLADLSEHISSASQLVDVVTQDRALVTSLLGFVNDWDTDTLFRASLSCIVSALTLEELVSLGLARSVTAVDLQVPDHLRDMINSYDRVGRFYTGRQLI